jgi:hypothetical protein
MHASHAGRGAQRIAFNQCGDNLFSFLGAQSVHESIMLDRSSSVKQDCAIMCKNVNFFAKGNSLTLERFRYHTCFTKRNECGAGGIPTRGTRQRPPVYKTGALRPSATAPNRSVSEKAGDLIHHRFFIFLRSLRCVLLSKRRVVGVQAPFALSETLKTGFAT